MKKVDSSKSEEERRKAIKEARDIGDKIMYGLELAYDRLVERTRKNNGTLVIMKDGKIVEIKP